ncbi:hypothetical protein ABPG74_016199 [Tetrahymena malaccensis]
MDSLKQNQNSAQKDNQQKDNNSQKNMETPEADYETPGRDDGNNNRKEQEIQILQSQSRHMDDQTPDEKYQQRKSLTNIQFQKNQDSYQNKETPGQNDNLVSNSIPIIKNLKKLQEELQSHHLSKHGLLEKLLLKLNQDQKYEALELIGLGSYSVVYSTKKKNSNQNIALRIQQIECQVRFKNQISIWKQIQMPLIVELYEVYQIELEGHTFAIFELELFQCNLMELIEGQEQYQELSIEKKMSIAKQLIDAINYIHSFNILHMDIKPDNIGIKFNNGLISLKLCVPYSIERIKDSSSSIKTTHFIGTMMYGAPENFTDNNNFIYSKESDIYSLGVTLCRLDNYKTFTNFRFVDYFRLLSQYFSQPFEKFQINRQSELYEFIEQFCKYKSYERKPLQSIVDKNPTEFLSNKQSLEVAKQAKQLTLFYSGCQILQNITQKGDQVELNYGENCSEFYFLEEDQKQNEDQKDNNFDQTLVLSKKQLTDKIERHSQFMNPHIPKIEQEDISFTQDYFLYYNIVHKDPKIVQQMEQKTSEVINNISQNIKRLDQTKYLQELKPDNQCSILKGVLFNYLRNEGHQVQLSDEQGSEEDLVSFQQSLSFLTGQVNNSKYYELHIPDSDDVSYENIISSQNNLKQFTQKFIASASQAYQVPESSIHILNIKKGSTEVHYLIKEVVNICLEKIQSVLSETFKNITIALKSLLSNSIIKDSYFDSKFNYYWDESHQRIRSFRGSLTELGKELQPKRYYFPIKYLGFAINVQNIKVIDSDWLKKGPTAWIVLYHGTDLQGYQGITETYIQPGTKNFYGDKHFKCRLTGEAIKAGERANTYLSDLATLGKYQANIRDTAEYYSQKKPIEFCGKKYYLIFQCRVNPKYVKSPEKKEHFYTVESQYAKDNIIPYRILLKEIENIQIQQQNLQA